MLAPGRARLATRPLPTGSPTTAKTAGITREAFLTATAVAVAPGDDHVDLERHKLGRQLGEARRLAIRPPILDRGCASFNPTELAQSPRKRGDPILCHLGG